MKCVSDVDPWLGNIIDAAALSRIDRSGLTAPSSDCHRGRATIRPRHLPSDGPHRRHCGITILGQRPTLLLRGVAAARFQRALAFKKIWR